jgi:hypothetical protein
MGAAHELSRLSKDKRDWSTKLRESGEDMFNNAVGSVIGALPYMDEKAKDDMMFKMSYGNLLPDGYVSTPEGVQKGLSSNIYFKNDRGQVKRNYAVGGSVTQETTIFPDGKAFLNKLKAETEAKKKNIPIRETPIPTVRDATSTKKVKVGKPSKQLEPEDISNLNIP